MPQPRILSDNISTIFNFKLRASHLKCTNMAIMRLGKICFRSTTVPKEIKNKQK